MYPRAKNTKFRLVHCTNFPSFFRRENELLKHQLRKYVSAVQMLRSQGGSAEGKRAHAHTHARACVRACVHSCKNTKMYLDVNATTMRISPVSFCSVHHHFSTCSVLTLTTCVLVGVALEIQGIHLEDSVQPSIPAAKPSIDYSHEASEYERKLIQVRARTYFLSHNREKLFSFIRDS